MDNKKIFSDQFSSYLFQEPYERETQVLEGRILRAPQSPGKIIHLQFPSLPSQITQIQTKDIPGSHHIDLGDESIPIFSTGEVTWTGQPVLAVAGNDSSLVNDWLMNVQMEIELAKEQKTTERKFVREKGNPKEAFGKASQIVEEVFTIPSRNCLEGFSAVTCLRKRSTLHLNMETAWPEFVLTNVSKALNIPRESITISLHHLTHKTHLYGDIWDSTLLATTAALLSWKAKSSVIVRNMPYNTPPLTSLPGAQFHLRAAIDTNGLLSALEGNIVIESGAYLPFESEILDRCLLGLFSIYSCKNYHIDACIKRNPTAPTTFGPAAGLELGFLAGELLTNRIADSTSTLQSQWKHNAFPKHNLSLGSGISLIKRFPMQELLYKVVSQSDYERKAASYKQTRLNGKNLKIRPKTYRGISLACSWAGNGFTTYSSELNAATIKMTLNTNGCLSVIVPSNTNAWILQNWSSIAEEILGIGHDKIRFESVNSYTNLINGPAIFGRYVNIYTPLFEKACKDIARSRFREALPLSTTRVHKLENQKLWDRESLEGHAFQSYSWGAVVVEVMVSTCTYTIDLIRVWLQIDGGKILMPKQAHIAVENAVENALCWCYSPQVPRIPIQISVNFLNSTERRSAKHITSLPWLLVPTAFVSAVRHASKRNINTLPITPEKIQSGEKYP